jgi:hypothetical protein
LHIFPYILGHIFHHIVVLEIVQITEPESAPQEVTATSIGNGTIRVEWETPCKMGRDIKVLNDFAPTTSVSKF